MRGKLHETYDTHSAVLAGSERGFALVFAVVFALVAERDPPGPAPDGFERQF